VSAPPRNDSGRACRERALAWISRGIENAMPAVHSIDLEALRGLLADAPGAPVQLLDARSPEEYRLSHLPGARLCDPAGDAELAETTLHDLDASKPVVVYCSVGFRSARLALRLEKAGFSDVRNLRGGIFAWASEETAPSLEGEAPDRVHPYGFPFGYLLPPGRRARPGRR